MCVCVKQCVSFSMPFMFVEGEAFSLFLQFALISALTLDDARSHERLQKVRHMLVSEALYNSVPFHALMDAPLLLLF